MLVQQSPADDVAALDEFLDERGIILRNSSSGPPDRLDGVVVTFNITKLPLPVLNRVSVVAGSRSLDTGEALLVGFEAGCPQGTPLNPNISLSHAVRLSEGSDLLLSDGPASVETRARDADSLALGLGGSPSDLFVSSHHWLGRDGLELEGLGVGHCVNVADAWPRVKRIFRWLLRS